MDLDIDGFEARRARAARTRALENAVRSADVDTVRQLLAGDTRPSRCIPAQSLIVAANRHDANDAVEMTRLLIEHGANVNNPVSNFSPLFAAVMVGSPPEVVRLLLSNGADANYIFPREYGNANHLKYAYMRPLHMACQTGELEHARLLIDSGADVNAPQCLASIYSVPIASAAFHGHLAIVRLLLDRGAQVDSVNHFGETALHHASSHGHEAIVRLLLDRGARADTQTNEGSRTPLAYACRWGHAAVARLLLDRSGPHAQVDGFHSVHGHLYNTCRYSETTEGGAGRVAVAHLLLERGAEVDRPMPNEMSTLDLLACNDRPKLKKLVRKFLVMCVRRCVLGPVSEHSRRQVARDVVAPKIASFLV